MAIALTGLLACAPARTHQPASVPSPPPPQSSDQQPAGPAEPRAAVPAELPRVEVACDAASTWTSVSDTSAIEVILAAARLLSWTDHTFGPPAECQLRVAERCAPDLDGDGSPEVLTHLGWSIRTDDAVDQPCSTLESHDPSIWPAEAIVILSGTADSRTALAVVTYTVRDGQTDSERTLTDFVQLPDGRIGMRGTSRFFESSRGCDLVGEWVAVLEQGAVRAVIDTTPSTCSP